MRSMKIKVGVASAIVVVAALVAASLGSSSGPVGSGGKTAVAKCGAGTGKKATGAPIKLGGIDMLIPGVDFTTIGKVANAYFQCVNDNGGVNGHPLKLFVELDQTQPAQVAAAAKKLIQSDHVVAIDGVFDLLECTIDQGY
jgi:branched-chain amino acid transport system substrate-binding protein